MQLTTLVCFWSLRVFQCVYTTALYQWIIENGLNNVRVIFREIPFVIKYTREACALLVHLVIEFLMYDSVNAARIILLYTHVQ